MFNKFLLVSLFAASSVLSTATALAQQKLIADQSTITFTSKQMGVPVDGKFGKFEAQIAFDPKAPAAAKIGFTVDIASTVIGDADTVKELRKPEWFNMAKFPTANFQSTATKALGAGKFEVAGNLTIKGKANPVTAVVQLTRKGDTTLVEGNFPIKRLAFNLGEGDWKDVSMVADEVVVKVKLALAGVAPL